MDNKCLTLNDTNSHLKETNVIISYLDFIKKKIVYITCYTSRILYRSFDSLLKLKHLNMRIFILQFQKTYYCFQLVHHFIQENHKI